MNNKTPDQSRITLLEMSLAVLIRKSGGEVVITPEEIEALYGLGINIVRGPGKNFTLKVTNIGKTTRDQVQ